MRKKSNDVVILRALLSLDEHVNLNMDNVKYLFNEQVMNCQIKIYQKLVFWLNIGLTYDEILEKIDGLNLEVLNENEQNYVKDDARNILAKRKIKQRERMINYE